MNGATILTVKVKVDLHCNLNCSQKLDSDMIQFFEGVRKTKIFFEGVRKTKIFLIIKNYCKKLLLIIYVFS